MSESIQITLAESELKSLYVQLKRVEGQLGEDMCRLLLRIEKALYEKLTIEELERLRSSFEAM
jgi:hypothetical protein